MSTPIVHRGAELEEIRRELRELPLGALREMLPDSRIIEACKSCGHAYRRRLYDPVVTVFHFLLQAVGREESFASTSPGRSALTRARGRLPRAVMVRLAREVCRRTQDAAADRWKGYRLRAIDVTCVAMPRNDELAKHFGLHRAVHEAEAREAIP